MPANVVAAIGCWVAFLIRQARSGVPIADPAGATLAAIAAEGTAAEVVAALVRRGLGIPAEVAADAPLVAALQAAAEHAQAGRWDVLLA